MINDVGRLIMYNHARQSDDGRETVLFRLAKVLDALEKTESDEELIKIRSQAYDAVHDLLEIADKYDFSEELWQSYIAYLLATDENPFSIRCEMTGDPGNPSFNAVVRGDMECFYRLFHYDMEQAEQRTGIDGLALLTKPCEPGASRRQAANDGNASKKISELCKGLKKAESGDDFLQIVTGFYKQNGVGTFGLNKAFRVLGEDGGVSLLSIRHTSDVTLSDLVGYEEQKERLIENTEAFVSGRPANNCLLYGDAGTGKSTCIKAIVNMYYDRGLRIIELYRHQFRELAHVMNRIQNRNYRFILYMDDLSFEEFETDYKYLKAVIEGGLEVRPDNILIYATSNRRHLIRETWSDRPDINRDEEVFRTDTMQEKLSLVSRFGVSIGFDKPSKALYDEIVVTLAQKAGITMDTKELLARANVWSLRNGGYSGRTAEYFIVSLCSAD